MHSNHAACTAKPHYHWSFVFQLPISSNLIPGRLHAAHFQKLNGFWRVTESSQTFENDIWFSYIATGPFEYETLGYGFFWVYEL